MSRTQIGWIIDSDISEAIDGDDSFGPDIAPLEDYGAGQVVSLNGRWDLPVRAVYVDDYNPEWDIDYMKDDAP